MGDSRFEHGLQFEVEPLHRDTPSYLLYTGILLFGNFFELVGSGFRRPTNYGSTGPGSGTQT